MNKTLYPLIMLVKDVHIAVLCGYPPQGTDKQGACCLAPTLQLTETGFSL